ncbi:MAG: recombinase family protein, partial [Anaerolineae bacterium]|nr:recombinase family protein [Anaerolineae bacterium]
ARREHKQLTRRVRRATLNTSKTLEAFDFTTPFGKLILAVLGAFAEWYVNNLAAETRKGKRQRAKAGGWNGTLSFGYTTPRRVKGELLKLGEQFKKGKVDQQEYSRKADLWEDALEKYIATPDSFAIPSPFNREGVVLAYTLYSTGKYSDADVAWELNNAGYRSTGTRGRNLFGKDTVTWLLQNRFYLGETSYQGPNGEREWMEGAHEPLISQALFDRCQTVRKWRASERTTSRHKDVNAFPLTGMLVCAQCGTNFRGWTLRGKRRYRDPARELGKDCQRRPRSIKAGHLEDQITALLVEMSLHMPKDWRKRALKNLAMRQSPEPEQIEQKRTLEVRLQRLKDLYVIGDLDRDAYQEQRNILIEQMPEEPIVINPVNVEQVGLALTDIEALFHYASPEDKKTVLSLLFNRAYVNDREIIALEATTALWQLQTCAIMAETTQFSGMDGFDTFNGSDGLGTLTGCAVFTRRSQKYYVFFPKTLVA